MPTAQNSPEFEFWSSIPPPNLVPADELFVDGILLPLQLLHLPTDPQPPPVPAPLSASKRLTNFFKKSTPPSINKPGPELNINIWPFSRSRSAGNTGARPRMFSATRKVSSAPCSRSNSKSRKWPGSPARPGVHLGRSSPVWQVRRGSAVDPGVVAGKKESRRIKTKGGRTSEVVNSKGPMCMGYRHHLSCTRDGNGGAGTSGGSSSGNAGSGAALFNLRSLFNKKVY